MKTGCGPLSFKKILLTNSRNTCQFFFYQCRDDEVDVDVTEGNALRPISGSVVVKQFLDNGFTTSKEIGNDANYATADIIKAINNGWMQGPTIIYAGKIIASYGGQSGELIRNMNIFGIGNILMRTLHRKS